ncbi:MAG TPA: DUF2461 domain-containing protein [Solirubrobacteraceae bacterium]|nr:DUF2461 domain-containing protein [Solirubrobacteraceae bacterium]
MTEEPSFGPELFGFLAELKDHNDRDWFAANKGRYEADLLEPALAFIEDFEPHLQAISPHLRADARRVGGSMFRIYRDTRFSKDKSPYKTMAGIYFRHERSKEVRAPGFYLHLAPREVFAGGGIWHPDTKTANAIREAIAADPEGWRAATSGIELGQGDALKRVPQGFDKEHPLADDLKRRDFAAIERLSEDEATAPRFLERYADACRSMAPLMRFLCGAVGVRF